MIENQVFPETKIKDNKIYAVLSFIIGLFVIIYYNIGLWLLGNGLGSGGYSANLNNTTYGIGKKLVNEGYNIFYVKMLANTYYAIFLPVLILLVIGITFGGMSRHSSKKIYSTFGIIFCGFGILLFLLIMLTEFSQQSL